MKSKFKVKHEMNEKIENFISINSTTSIIVKMLID